MTKERLQTVKSIATWGGVAVTFFGIVFGLIRGGSWVSSGIALAGLVVTAIGHFVSKALNDHQKREKAADEARIVELTDRLDSAESRLDDPDLKRLTEREKWDYIIEHQDDGR